MNILLLISLTTLSVTANKLDNFTNKKVNVRTAHGTYMKADNNDAITILNGKGLWEEFTILKQHDGRYVLKTFHNMYVKAEPGNFGHVLQHRWVGEWEKYEINPAGDKWTIKTHHGTYLHANDKNGIDTHDTIGDWEKFSIEIVKSEHADVTPFLNKTIAIRFTNGMYLKADVDRETVTTLPGTGLWETFTLIPSENGKFAIKTYYDTFIRGKPDGTVDQHVANHDWEKFEILKAENGLSFKTHHGLFLHVDGDKITQRGHQGPSSTFQRIPANL